MFTDITARQQAHALTVLATTVGRHEGSHARPEFQRVVDFAESDPSRALLALVEGRDVADTDAMLEELAAASGRDPLLPSLIVERRAGHAVSAHSPDWAIAFVSCSPVKYCGTCGAPQGTCSHTRPIPNPGGGN